MASEKVVSKSPSVTDFASSPASDDAESLGAAPKVFTTKRGLAGRHVQLMSIGGSIGTGLFVGIGSSLRSSGPLSVVLAYIVYCTTFIFHANMAVGEMAAYLPIRGSVFEFASRYVDPALGFGLGWTYFYASSMLVCAEMSAVATVMGFWLPDTNAAAWIAMSLGVCLLLNVFAVKYYGETEFIFACTKILLLVGLVLLTFITMLGGNPKNDRYGFRYWGNGNAMHEYMDTGVTGRFLGWWKVVLYAAFSVSGPDLIALAAGEMIDPRRNIPRVARRAFWRIAGFYIVGVFAVGIICSSRDERLLGAIDGGQVGSAASPWVIGIQNLGIQGLPSLINVLILLSGWSCGNAFLYSSSRTLYSLALDGQAPKFFLKCTQSGVPIHAVLTVGLLSCITFLVASSSATEVLSWFINLCTIGFVVSYTCFLITYIGWFNALRAQGISRDTLPFKAPFMPYAAYFGVGTGCVVVLFAGFNTFKPFDTQGFVTSYFGVVFAIIMFTFWKFYKKTEFVKPENADLFTGKAEVDEECKIWEQPGAPKTKGWAKFWDELW
ncbi:amino acid permease [Phlyctema vagabunda]|uniref:Amino acid permease n=1 Tax=Phlyctema vagabunda TaxID=108571 RepID=A0ABR4P5F6_9HELO